MRSPISIKQLFLTKQRQFEMDLQTAHAGSEHPLRRGEAAEKNWISALRDYLPSRYGIEKGFVIDSDEGISKEIDVLIFDRYYTPMVFVEKGHLYVASESVYAAIEVKTTLNRGTMEDAVKKIESVRRLNRYTRAIRRAEGLDIERKFEPVLGVLLASKWGLSGPVEPNLREWASEWAPSSRLDLVSVASSEAFELVYRSGLASVTASQAGYSTMFTLLTIAKRLQDIGNVPPIDTDRYRRFV